MLAILEALLKWEDKLVGYRVHIVMDHKVLEFFKTQPHLSNCQRRWMDYLSCFNFNITYIKGKNNKVVDCLSRYFEDDRSANLYEYYKYVDADKRIDPEGEDLPNGCIDEIQNKMVGLKLIQDIVPRCSKWLQEKKEDWELEAQLMKDAQLEQPKAIEAILDSWMHEEGEDITLGDSLFKRREEAPKHHMADNKFLMKIKRGYSKDPILSLVIDKPGNYSKIFKLKDNVLWRMNPHRDKVPCVPQDRPLIMELIEQAHKVIGHLNELRTIKYL